MATESLPTERTTALPATGLIKLGNKTINYYREGPPGAPAIVFTHGMGLSDRYFDDLISHLRLCDRHCLHRFDYDGHGLSPVFDATLPTVQSYAADLAALFHHANLTSNVVIISHSLGCFVSMQAALTAPNVAKATKALILLNSPALPMSPPGLYGCQQRIEIIKTKGIAGTIKAIVDLDVAPEESARCSQSRNEAISKLTNALSVTSDCGFSRANQAVVAWGTRDMCLEDLTCKALLITGDKDMVGAPSQTMQMARRMANAEVVILNGVGHHPVWEDISTTGQLIDTFLKSC
ncbi:Alpha/Beta hydrolase protein [Aspergillus bertholletiae]|uniref:Alpha/Beta hydrolase protein n=1 Tax=Aspergillus bertholletiae TaxID=1226010 RepID=A0A5N7B8A7_9EURO|nr:Alpha/Beta hydrolase protein [Aspergillus bertholletiae]